MSKVFEVNNLWFRYGESWVLEKINFTIQSGEFVALIGPNGSAKTTLLRLLLGLLQPQLGEILFQGQKLNRHQLASHVGYLGQKATSFNASFPATVAELLRSSIDKKWFSRDVKTEDAMIEKALRKVEMLPFWNRMIGELSGGQQQRVFLARALLTEPDVLILDEPTNALDAQGSQALYELLSHFQKEHGLTMIMISHDVLEMVRRSSRLIVLNDRKVYYDGPPSRWVQQEGQNVSMGSATPNWSELCAHCPDTVQNERLVPLGT